MSRQDDTPLPSIFTMLDRKREARARLPLVSAEKTLPAIAPLATTPGSSYSTTSTGSGSSGSGCYSTSLPPFSSLTPLSAHPSTPIAAFPPTPPPSDRGGRARLPSITSGSFNGRLPAFSSGSTPSPTSASSVSRVELPPLMVDQRRQTSPIDAIISRPRPSLMPLQPPFSAGSYSVSPITHSPLTISPSSTAPLPAFSHLGPHHRHYDVDSSRLSSSPSSATPSTVTTPWAHPHPQQHPHPLTLPLSHNHGYGHPHPHSLSHTIVHPVGGMMGSPSGHHHHHHHHLMSPGQMPHGFAPPSQDRYVCPTCSKSFSRPSSLRIHSHSHTGEKPFQCSHAGCGKAFSVRSNMKRHERGCHAAVSPSDRRPSAPELAAMPMGLPLHHHHHHHHHHVPLGRHHHMHRLPMNGLHGPGGQPPPPSGGPGPHPGGADSQGSSYPGRPHRLE